VAEQQSVSRAPSFVSRFNPIAQRLLHIGMPLGPNALITITGRKSGVPRTTPVALVEVEGNRYVIGTFGETNWVRNLRTAGEAIISVGGKAEEVSTVELSKDAAAEFFSGVLGPFINHIPLGLGRFMIGTVLGARDILDNPAGAAELRPVFEIHTRAA
jgi:deazaflavin-dependent oxidoreductase (nitroreductase family)